jgi:hypothetical protein
MSGKTAPSKEAGRFQIVATSSESGNGNAVTYFLLVDTATGRSWFSLANHQSVKWIPMSYSGDAPPAPGQTAAT